MHKTGRKIQYQINIPFLQEWSHDLAYILGFTMADGFVTNSQKTLQYAISVKDIEILKFIQSKLCPSRPIIFSNCIKNNKVSKIAIFKLSAYDIMDLLKSYNLFPNKTGKEKLPNIPEKYKFDYFRGLIDGDGCIYITKNKCAQLHLVCSNQQFLEDVQKEICLNYGRISKKGNNCFQYRICKQNDLLQIYRLMYNGGFYLSRKKDKFKEGKLWINSK